MGYLLFLCALCASVFLCFLKIRQQPIRQSMPLYHAPTSLRPCMEKKDQLLLT